MTGIATLERSGAGLAAAADAGDWGRAERELAYLVGAWRRARLDGEDTAAFARQIERLRLEIATGHDVDAEPGPAQIAWMLRGACLFLSDASAPVVGSGDTASRILAALAADATPISTTALAALVGRSVEGVARALPGLRDRGLTSQASAGRKVLNAITPEGLAHVEGRAGPG